VNVLVDTSIWSLELCRKAHDPNPAERAVVAELTNLIKEGRAESSAWSARSCFPA
jgi:hypothetical protein